ncbi:hypothetical protein EDB83DRAFT_1584519 [Lactarius deliciosus]|nr:hypothetical protein EDB83DRAFT_1584519 [Lactarius deliciosus]
MRVIESSSPRRQFAFTILCDVASAGKSFWMLQCPSNYSRIPTFLSSLFWHGELQLGQRTSWRDPSRLLDALLKRFISTKAGSFENLLDPFLKICRHSTPIAIGIAKAQFFLRVSEKLSNSKAVVKLNLLCILRAVCEHQNRALLVERYGIHEAIAAPLRKDCDVLVRERSSLASHPHSSPPSEVQIPPRARLRRRDAPRGAPPATRLISERRRPRLARARWTTRASRALALARVLARRADSRRACMLATSRGNLASAWDGLSSDKKHDLPSVRYVLYYRIFSLYSYFLASSSLVHAASAQTFDFWLATLLDRACSSSITVISLPPSPLPLVFKA